MGAIDAQVNYQASRRNYYSGLNLNSGTAFEWFGFSGTTSKFGTNGNECSSRILIAPSGCDAGFSHDGTALHGHVFDSESLQFDGMQKSGLHIRSDTDSSFVRVWAW